MSRLASLLEQHSARADGNLEDFLAGNGYIWQTDDGSAWTPGIPSLMEYMIELTEG